MNSSAIGQIKFSKLNFSQALQLAKAKKMYLFVDCYTIWCQPCKMMDKHTFSHEEVGEVYSDKFLSIKVNMEAEAGLELAEKYQVKSYPTLLYFDSSGDLVHRHSGALTHNEFLTFTEEVLDEKKQFIRLSERYAEGERTPQFLYNFFFATEKSGLDGSKIADDWFETVGEKQAYCLEGLEIFTQLDETIHSSFFQFVAQNIAQYGAVDPLLFPEGWINYAVSYNLELQLERCLALPEYETELAELQLLVDENMPDFSAEFRALAQYLIDKDDIEKAWDAKVAYLEVCSNYLELNNQAWDVYENHSDPEKIQLGLAWAKRAIQFFPEYSNMDTYAHLLFKSKQFDEAAEVAQAAIDLGKKWEEDTEATEKLQKKALRKSK